MILTQRRQNFMPLLRNFKPFIKNFVKKQKMMMKIMSIHLSKDFIKKIYIDHIKRYQRRIKRTKK